MDKHSKTRIPYQCKHIEYGFESSHVWIQHERIMFITSPSKLMGPHLYIFEVEELKEYKWWDDEQNTLMLESNKISKSVEDRGLMLKYSNSTEKQRKHECLKQTNLAHLLCSTIFHELGSGMLQGPTLAWNDKLTTSWSIKHIKDNFQFHTTITQQTEK